MSRRGLRSSWQRSGARLLTAASLLTLPALSVFGMDRRAAAAAADSPDLCLDDALCNAHYTRARTLSHRGEYQAALEAYQTAYRRRAASWLLLNMGRTLHKLGRPSEALGYYNQYKEKETHPAPEQEAKLSEYLKEAQEELAQTAAAAAAKQPPELPSPPSKVASGERSEAAAPPAAESSSTAAEPAPPALVGTPPHTGAAPMAAAEPDMLRTPLLRPPGEAPSGTTAADRENGARMSIVRSRSSRVAAGSVLGALGLAGIAAGIGFYAQTAAERSQFSLTGDEFDKLALLKRSQAFQVAAPIGLGVGAALLATGVSLLGHSAYKARHRDSSRPQVALLPQTHGFMLGLTGAY